MSKKNNKLRISTYSGDSSQLEYLIQRISRQKWRVYRESKVSLEEVVSIHFIYKGKVYSPRNGIDFKKKQSAVSYVKNALSGLPWIYFPNGCHKGPPVFLDSLTDVDLRYL